MNLTYQPINVYNHHIYVAFSEHEVHVINNQVLNELLKNEALVCRDIAQVVKHNYENLMEKRLNISTDSIALEILGHVYPNKIASVLYTILPALKTMPGFILDKTDIIDIGESGYDSNRWIWDRLEPLYTAIADRLH
jgi:hypothetical protein